MPDIVGMGGTIPITETFRDVLGVDTVFFSFSVADEDIHAPNEFYRLDRFGLGLRAWARLWRTLGPMGRGLGRDTEAREVARSGDR